MATKLDIVIPQNGTFRMVISVTGGPTDITAYTGEMQVRAYKADPDTLADITNDSFTMNQGTRQVIMLVPAVETELYDWDGYAVYDMYLVGPTGDRWRLVEGLARLSKTVTRED